MDLQKFAPILHKVAVCIEMVAKWDERGNATDFQRWFQSAHLGVLLLLGFVPVSFLILWPWIFAPIRANLGRIVRNALTAELLLEVLTLQSCVYLIYIQPDSGVFWILLSGASISCACAMRRIARRRRW